VNTVQERLQADLVLSIAIVPTADSLVRMIQMRDLQAPAGFNFRVVTRHVPASAPPEQGVSDLMPRVMETLAEMNRTRMRVPGQGEAPDGRRISEPRPPRP